MWEKHYPLLTLGKKPRTGDYSSRYFKFLARQGLPLCGHDDAESNFMQLLELRKLDDPGLAKWLERKVDKYCLPEIQNEILQLISTNLLQFIAKSLQSADFFTVMADDCTDIGNKKQLTVCFR